MSRFVSFLADLLAVESQSPAAGVRLAGSHWGLRVDPRDFGREMATRCRWWYGTVVVVVVVIVVAMFVGASSCVSEQWCAAEDRLCHDIMVGSGSEGLRVTLPRPCPAHMQEARFGKAIDSWEKLRRRDNTE